MKKLLLTLLALAMMPLATEAQEATTDSTASTKTRNKLKFEPVKEHPNQMSVRVAGYELLLEREERPTRFEEIVQLLLGADGQYKLGGAPYGGRIGLWEIGLNGFRNAPGAYSMYPAEERGFMDLDVSRSIHVSWNFYTFSTSFTRNNTIGLTMGVSCVWNDYAFETKNRYARVDGMIRPVAPETELKKSKLGIGSIRVPLALEINPSRNFFVSFGGYVDLVTNSLLKSKHPKEKLMNVNTNFFQAGLTLRMGFHTAYFFGHYGLTEMFKDGRGPALNPFTFGIGWGF
jgi:hypothetical protein